MPDTERGDHDVETGTKEPNVVRGAPFPPGGHQSDGPERPRRRVPRSESPDDSEEGVSAPTETEDEDGHS